MKTIYKKELARIFKDKKMIFSVFLLPVLIMVGIMALVGNLATRQVEDIENHRSIVYMINEPDSFSAFLEAADLNMEVNTIKTDGERENVMDLLRNGDADLLIEFPENFDSMIQEYQTGDEVPQIKTYYNPSEDYSSSAYELISNQTLEAYRQTLLSQRVADMNGLQIFTVNSDNKDMIVQDDQKASGKALGMMLPYFITILLFAGFSFDEQFSRDKIVHHHYARGEGLDDDIRSAPERVQNQRSQPEHDIVDNQAAYRQHEKDDELLTLIGVFVRIEDEGDAQNIIHYG